MTKKTEKKFNFFSVLKTEKKNHRGFDVNSERKYLRSKLTPSRTQNITVYQKPIHKCILLPGIFLLKFQSIHRGCDDEGYTLRRASFFEIRGTGVQTIIF